MFIGIALLGVCMVTLGIAIAVVGPMISQRMARVRELSDFEKMRTIVKALNEYNDRYSSFPPPAVVDSKGKKLYSWRVLILPFMGHETLYNRFVKDQAWDSVANYSLIREMPIEFASSMSPDGAALHESNFSLIVGNGTIFPASGPLASKDVSDTPTILVIETKNGSAVWTQPADIDASKGLRLGNKSYVEAGGVRADVVLAVTVDDQQLRIPKATEQKVLDALVSPNGNETFDTKAIVVP